MMEYCGFQIPEQENDREISRVKITDLNPNFFFENFVSKRKPCIIEGLTPEIGSADLWNNERLKKTAGDKQVKVEFADDAEKEKRFGLGRRKTLLFKHFLNEVEKGNSTLYLSAQQVEEEVEEEEEDPLNNEHENEDDLKNEKFLSYHAPPVSQLLADNELALCPKLLGNMILHQINMWMGFSKEKSQSGLHHDYHDNLYLLFDGQKEFTLGSPKDIPNIYTHGIVKKVFKNGRVLYEGMDDVTEYGLSIITKSNEICKRAQKRIEELELEMESTEDEDKLDSLQEKMDEQLEYMLQAAAATNCGHDEDEDDEEDEEEDEEKDNADFGFSSFKNRVNDKIDTLIQTSLDKLEHENDMISNDKDDNDNDNDNDNDDKNNGQEEKKNQLINTLPNEIQKKNRGGVFTEEKKVETKTTENDINRDDLDNKEELTFPESFSKINDVDVQDPETLKKFPLYSKRCFTTVTLNKNEMLYLPAGWIHNVRSSGGRHMALNYWVYPPNTNSFSNPYSDDILKYQFERRSEFMKRKHDDESDEKCSKRFCS